MGADERAEMLFWTKEEYMRFAEVMMDKPQAYYAFQMLYWCGIRVGEMLALTPEDFDFKNGTLRINKSYQRLKGEDVITSPKTKKSNQMCIRDRCRCSSWNDIRCDFRKSRQPRYLSLIHIWRFDARCHEQVNTAQCR